MREYNCDALKGMTVPEERMKKALAVPAYAHTTPIPPKNSRRRALAAAAVFALVFLVSLSVYFIFGNINNAPIEIVPSTVSPTEPSVTDTFEPTAPAPSDTSAPTDTPTQQGTDNTEPSVSPSQGSTEDSSQAPSQSPSEKPTEQKPTSATEKPTTPEPRPTTATEKPTEPPVVPQTDPVIYEPTDSPWEPIEAPTDSPAGKALREYIRFNAIPLKDFSGYIYVRFNTYSGVILGDPDLYSYTHLAEYEIRGNWIYIRYKSSKLFDYPTTVSAPINSIRTVVFYDSEGKQLGLQQGYTVDWFE